MTDLRIGYDLFAGSTQAGTDSSVMGNIQIETAKALKYKLQVQRLSDDNYWNNVSSPGWQAGVPSEADDLDFVGSDELNPQAIRRCMMKLPKEVLDGIDLDGYILTAYATGDTPAADGVAITLPYKPVT